MAKALMFAIAAVVAVLAGFALIVLYFTYSPPDDTEIKKVLAAAEQAINRQVEKPIFASETDPGSSYDAYVMAMFFVSDRLKAPATAQFSPFGVTVIRTEPDFKWVVKGYVDSQNSFGGLMRNRFLAEMTYRGGGEYRLDNLKFWE